MMTILYSFICKTFYRNEPTIVRTGHRTPDVCSDNMTIYFVAYFNWLALVFCSLVAVELATAFQYESFIESELETNGGCHSIKDQYWKLIQWFYGVVNIVFVNLIVDTNSKHFHFQQLDTFSKGISERKHTNALDIVQCPIKYNNTEIVEID